MRIVNHFIELGRIHYCCAVHRTVPVGEYKLQIKFPNQHRQPIKTRRRRDGGNTTWKTL